MASNDEQRSATTILTTAAQSIAARLIANETTAKFTKAEISTTNLFNQSVTELQVLTSLDNVQQTADINTVTVINNNTVNVNVAIDQTKAPNNYQMNSVGLFAVDGDGKEVLYSVTVLKDPVYIHQDAMGSALGIDLETVVGQASNVEISVNPAGAVTNEILKATLADYVKTDDVKSLIPATVIDGSKPADFKEAVTLEKGAVDGTGNAIATTKNVSDGDAETLKSAKDYADTKISGKADDSKVVHTADMRKPASDVAGIEEVNAKQDKIGYTPADDSKVLHNSGLATMPTDNSGLVVGKNGDIGLVKQMGTAGFFGVGSNNSFHVVQSNHSSIGIADTFHDMFKVNGNYQISLGPGAYFTPADDSKVVHSTDMRTPASDVAGIEEVNVKQDKIAYTPADDSKVAHLSGANNFDTVPTVNNNPLLLASSLPSDLARLSQDANFTAKLQQNGQDVALANNTIARNPDTGVVSEPVDFTKLTVEGGKSVATRDDLKSVIDNSWLPIKIADGWTSTPVLMKYDKTNGKTIITGMMSKPFGVSDGTCTEALLTLPDGFYWNEVDNSMIGINQANILEATINPDNKKELIVSYKWKWSSPASGNAFVGYNEAYSIGSDEKVTGTYYETTSISQA